MRKMNLSAVLAAIKSPKTPAALKKGLIKKYGHLLQGYKLPMAALATTVQANPKKKLVLEALRKHQAREKSINDTLRHYEGKSSTTVPRNIIEQALDTLNAQYGRGNIIHIDWKNNKVYCKKQYGQDIVSFKVIGNTVYFRGHQISITGGVAIHNPKKRKPRSPYDVVGEVYSGNPKHRFREGDIIALKKQPNSLHMVVGMGKYSYKLQSQKGMKWAAQYEVADKLFKLVDRDRG